MHLEHAVAAFGADTLDAMPEAGEPRGERVSPEVALHDQGCRAPGSRRPIHRSRSSWRASLPRRTGGLEYTPATLRPSGTASGSTATTLVAPARSALRAQRSSARRFTSTAQTRVSGLSQRQRDRDRAVAASNVHEIPGPVAARSCEAADRCRSRYGRTRRHLDRCRARRFVSGSVSRTVLGS